MISLATLCADPTSLLSRVKAKAPEPIRLRKIAAAMGNAEVVAQDLETTRELQQRIAGAIRSGEPADLTRRDLRGGCRAFLHPPQAPGRERDVGDPLFDLVIRLQRRAAYFALIDAYLDGFQTDDEDVAHLGRKLTASMSNWPWRPGDHWRQRHDTFKLFDADRAPKFLAAAVLGSEAATRAILDTAGLHTDGRRAGGLAEAAFVDACSKASKATGQRSIPLQRRVMDWARDGGTPLLFPKAWPDYAAALFTPWDRTDPPTEQRDDLIEAALSFAGDPRISGARWRPVEDTAREAYDVIVRWLTQASVEQFFDIVSETMTDRPDMWEQRRKFWTRYLKNKSISAAWVAFGTTGASRAEQIAQRTPSLATFGRLASGGGRTSQHAALIMRMGDLTVVEWSHNGRCYVWRRGDAHTPKLFQNNKKGWPDYSPGELMGGSFDITHMGDWQSRLAHFLRSEAGVHA